MDGTSWVPAGIQHLACQGIAFSGTEHRDDHALGINHFRPGLGTAAGDGVPRGAEQQALSGGAGAGMDMKDPKEFVQLPVLLEISYIVVPLVWDWTPMRRLAWETM